MNTSTFVLITGSVQLYCTEPVLYSVQLYSIVMQVQGQVWGHGGLCGLRPSEGVRPREIITDIRFWHNGLHAQ